MKRTVLIAAVVLGGLGIITLLPLNADEPANRRPRPEGRESFRGPGRPGMEGGDRSDMRDQVLRRFDEMLNRLERIEQRLGGGNQHERAHAGQGPHSPGHSPGLSPGMEQQRGPRPHGPKWMGERGPEGFGPRSADQGPRGPNTDRMEGGFARRLDLPEEMRQKMEERMRQGREQMEQAREKMAQAREKFMEMQQRIEKLEAEVKQLKESLKPTAEAKKSAKAK
jgi:Spy/CpxP family protein refolding chaperone